MVNEKTKRSRKKNTVEEKKKKKVNPQCTRQLYVTIFSQFILPVPIVNTDLSVEFTNHQTILELVKLL